jgi:hypothetical protein
MSAVAMSDDLETETVVDAMFRDTHREWDGSESVLREYTLQAVIDR